MRCRGCSLAGRRSRSTSCGRCILRAVRACCRASGRLRRPAIPTPRGSCCARSTASPSCTASMRRLTWLFGAPISDVEFANEVARLIESITALGGTDDLLRSLPDGAGQAVLGARDPTAVPEGNDRARQRDSPRSPLDVVNASEPPTSVGHVVQMLCTKHGIVL